MTLKAQTIAKVAVLRSHRAQPGLGSTKYDSVTRISTVYPMATREEPPEAKHAWNLMFYLERVTLSYFVEPSPGERGWDRKYGYLSHWSAL